MIDVHVAGPLLALNSPKLETGPSATRGHAKRMAEVMVLGSAEAMVLAHHHRQLLG